MEASRSTTEEIVKADERPGYTIGHKESALALMRFRTAERCCGFARSYVQEDSDVLDCGCGPGTITVGLAQWAPRGRTVGVDLGDAQLEGARALARELGLANVEFRRADLFALPFPGESFDVVFSQAVFCHIPDHDRALSEMKRVLRPGGHLAISDIINGFAVRWPDEPLLQEVGRLFRLGQQHSGGNPDIGRELGALLHRAGFVDVFLTLRFEQPERPEERSDFYAIVAELLGSSDLGALAVAEGWITSERLAEVVARFRALAGEPGSISGLPFGQAVGRKPG